MILYLIISLTLTDSVGKAVFLFFFFIYLCYIFRPLKEGEAEYRETRVQGHLTRQRVVWIRRKADTVTSGF